MKGTHVHKNTGTQERMRSCERVYLCACAFVYLL